MKKHYRIAPEVKEQIFKRIKEEGVPVSQAAKEHGQKLGIRKLFRPQLHQLAAGMPPMWKI